MINRRKKVYQYNNMYQFPNILYNKIGILIVISDFNVMSQLISYYYTRNSDVSNYNIVFFTHKTRM